MTASLRAPLGAYFAAHNAQDPDRVAVWFSEDAVCGTRDTTIAAAPRRAPGPAETSRKHHHTVVTARITGDFPGSPAEIRFRFRLKGDDISGLEVGLRHASVLSSP
jgi:hypothetical protein